MKTIFRSIISGILRLLAKSKLAKSKPTLIGITGSIGKTSTKDAVVAILRQKFQVKAADGGYNTEIGVPLMILNQRSDNTSSVASWARILWKAFLDVSQGEHMDVLVVEMGVDKPGDMRELTKIISPDIAILTSIAANHIAPGQFSSEQDILREKTGIAALQKKNNYFITNNDNPWIFSYVHTGSTRLRYGEDGANEFVVSNVTGNVQGISFHVKGRSLDHDFRVPILGTYHTSVLVPAIICGELLGLTGEEIQKGLADFQLPKGRLRLLPGVHNSTIIDSSYNASKAAMLHALELVDSLPAPRKILCLGQMNELGERTEESHLEVARLAAQIGNLFILVGPDAKIYEQELLRVGVEKGTVHHFLDSQEAGKFLLPLIQDGDLVFVKGSQGGVRLERLIAEILADPATAKDVLVRQGPEWQNR